MFILQHNSSYTNLRLKRTKLPGPNLLVNGNEEGNNADWPYADKEKGKSDDRGGITSTQKVGNFSHGLKFFFVVT